MNPTYQVALVVCTYPRVVLACRFFFPSLPASLYFLTLPCIGGCVFVAACFFQQPADTRSSLTQILATVRCTTQPRMICLLPMFTFTGVAMTMWSSWFPRQMFATFAPKYFENVAQNFLFYFNRQFHVYSSIQISYMLKTLPKPMNVCETVGAGTVDSIK